MARHGNDDELRELVSRPSCELQEAAAGGHLWLDSWGPRPDDAEQVVRIAERKVAAAPLLVPLHAWRYVPSAPARSGSPVFSYYYDDTIIIASTITNYVEQWAGERNVDQMGKHARTVPFWTELTERGLPLRCRQIFTGAGRRRQGSSGRPTSRLGGAVRGPRGGGGGSRVRPALRSDW